MTAHKFRVEEKIGDATYFIETGFLAKQAAGSVLIGYGDTYVLVATTTGAPRPGIDFFPLTVDYRERQAAAGKFPGGFLKREGRPTTKETLTSRLIDRPIRPLFPEWFHDEVQVQASVLSSDRQCDPDVLALTGASASLMISPLPFAGPIAGVRLGQIDGEFVLFPTQDQLEESDLDLIVAGSKDAVLMIEGFAREMPEDRMADALMTAHGHIQTLIALQEKLVALVNPTKGEYTPPDENPFKAALEEKYYEKLKTAQRTSGKLDRKAAISAVKEEAKKELVVPAAEGETAPDPAKFGGAFYSLEEKVVRDLILSGERSDGRKHNQLRSLYCEVDVLPRVHGSAVFQRGETQALITVTLGTGRDEQRVDGLIDEYSKKFMLDYYFPPFSVGETKPIRGPGRREIGHGMLAERSVKSVLPPTDQFPYTIRVISDILESNGSSSMASVSGATLGLMAAGVPIRNPVAGISVGLVKESDDKWVLLTDIQGEEDHHGDMDFKVAGSQNGITGIQLDLKIHGINEAIIRATLKQAREARLEILRAMLSAIPMPRIDTSRYAPRLERTQIPVDKIGMLIGPGGKTIRAIQEDTGTVIEVDDEGNVTVAGDTLTATRQAMARVEALTESVKVGKIYHGRVAAIKDFGAFVEILPGKDGLCHISELDEGYIRSVADVVQVGDEISVKVIGIDDHDRVKLSRKAAMAEMKAESGEVDSDEPADEDLSDEPVGDLADDE